MDWEDCRKSQNNYSNHSRNLKFGILKPNYRYFMGQINKIKDDFLTNNKNYLLANEPEIYYSMKGKKLPKKYENFQPFNFSSLIAEEHSNHEINQEQQFKKEQVKVQPNRIKEEKIHQIKVIYKKNDERLRRNQEAAEIERGYIQWVDPFEPINKNKLGSSQAWRVEKKYEYY